MNKIKNLPNCRVNNILFNSRADSTPDLNAEMIFFKITYIVSKS